MWLHLVIAGAVMALVVGIWFAVYYWLTPHLESPDGKARVLGTCGDTMELCLKFSNGRVVKTSHWTNGCVFSMNCLASAASQAEGKTPEQILDISPETIRDAIGGLPSDHMHCATLAVDTLHEAVNDYMKKSMASSCRRFDKGSFSSHPAPRVPSGPEKQLKTVSA
ncbi:MAG: iron-sulfur cluster assembly scaffold protein [Deltaproteobacteria bacterium]|nr:iron-sulfur cluster assembly scaffold protein [Deltaproteobacteria bacterium]